MLITELKSKESIDALLGAKAFIINCFGCKEVSFQEEEAKELLEPSKYIGRCPEQVERFLKEMAPLYEEAGSIDDELNV